MLDPDNVLHFIASSDLRESANPAKYIYRQFEKRHQMFYSDFVRTLEKLFRDGYLDKEEGLNQETTYVLTYEGSQFAKEGGYSRKHSMENVTNLPTKDIIRNILIGVITAIVGGIILWFILR